MAVIILVRGLVCGEESLVCGIVIFRRTLGRKFLLIGLGRFYYLWKDNSLGDPS